MRKVNHHHLAKKSPRSATSSALPAAALAAALSTAAVADEPALLQDSIGPISVHIAQNDKGYQLYRDGQPYEVKGAGTITTDLAMIASYGGNSIRTWAVDGHVEPAQELLDKAHQLGMTVSLCLEFGKERWGFDFDDKDAVDAMLAQVEERVLRFKDHPALLTWIIGNEVNLNYTNPSVFDAVNRAAKLIKQLDPHHPTTTALAGFDVQALNDIEDRAPDLDFISFQAYASLGRFPEYLQQSKFSKPFFVTEWGAVGHWEVESTDWGAPFENTSTEKAEHYLKIYQDVIHSRREQIIGNYVFLWGQKQERTPTWYGMQLETGEDTQAMDVMHYVWQGKWPDNRTPTISPIQLDNQSAADSVRLTQGKRYTAKVSVTDLDDDAITYQWQVRKESTADQVGGDKEEVPTEIQGAISGTGSSVSVTAPKQAGAYRLFVYAFDGNNNAAHANFPFYVN